MGKFRQTKESFKESEFLHWEQKICFECNQVLIDNDLDNECCEHCGDSFKHKKIIYCAGAYHYCSKCYKWLGKNGKMI